MIGRFRLVRFIGRLHVFLYRMSMGLFGSKLGRLEFMLVTTTGRLSGLPRTVPLLFSRWEDSYILIGSFAGSPRDPFWLSNIRKHSTITFVIGSEHMRGHAVIIEEGHPQYIEMWNKAVATYPAFDDYRNATERHLPIVLLRADNQS